MHLNPKKDEPAAVLKAGQQLTANGYNVAPVQKIILEKTGMRFAFFQLIAPKEEPKPPTTPALQPA
jgi:hypothetical protein